MADKKTEQIKVTLVKGMIGCTDRQRRTVEALGLNKTNSFNVVPKDAATLGKIKVVEHLVSCEEV